MGVPFVKAHAYGNDFLLVDALTARTASRPGALNELARRLCDRHQGVGADGLILYELRPGGATMRLFNADGSPSELSGNGLRCLAALVARAQDLPAGAQVAVDTDAGTKTLELLAREGQRYTYRAALGAPEDVRQVSIPVDGESLTASVLRLGNPQCVVLGPLPDPTRFSRLGPALATHPMFPAGTNVEFAHVEASDRVRIQILGARRGADQFVWDRCVSVGGRRRGARRRVERRGGDRPRRHATRRMACRRRVPDWLGRHRVQRRLAGQRTIVVHSSSFSVLGSCSTSVHANPEL